MLLALLLAAGPIYPLALPRGCRDRSCVRERVGGSYSLFQSYTFNAPGALPPCSGDAHCVALCYVSSGTTWTCIDNTGAAVGSISQGTSPTTENTFAPGLVARSAVNGTNAPTATGAAFDNLLGGDLTVISGGIWHTNGLANEAFAYLVNPGSLGNFLAAGVASGNFTCTFEESSSTFAPATLAPLSGWAVVSCRRSGNTRIARVNGADGIAVTTAGTRGVTSGVTAGFGVAPNNTSVFLNGPLAFVAFYSESKSTSWLTATENGFWGSNLDTGSGVSGLIGLPNDDGINVDFFSGGAHLVSPSKGLRTVGNNADNIQGKWAADPTDVSSWTQINNPRVTTNVMSGPTARWNNGTAECDRIWDVDAGAGRGAQSAELQRSTVAGAAHGWNVRVWAAAGDAGTTTNQMRVRLTSDGVFSTDGGTQLDCDFTLTGTPAPYDCQATTVDAGATTFKGTVLVNNVAGTQGSITVCHAQETPHYFPQLMVLNNTAFGAGVDTFDPSAWPNTAAKGKYEVVFTPLWDFSAQWDNAAGTNYLFDAFDGTPSHVATIIGGYTQSANLMSRVTNGLNFTEFDTSGQSSTPNQRYAVSLEWIPTGGGHCKVWQRYNACAGAASACFATTIINSSTDGTGWCPGQPTSLHLGNRYDATVPTSDFIDAVRIYQ